MPPARGAAGTGPNAAQCWAARLRHDAAPGAAGLASPPLARRTEAPAREADDGVCHHVHMAGADDLSEGEQRVLVLHPHWKTVLMPMVILIGLAIAAAVLLAVI